MSKTHQNIDDNLARWIREQHMFFVATAPLAVNHSPKARPKSSGCTGRVNRFQGTLVTLF